VTQPSDIALRILELADSDPRKRSESASRLYLEGSSLCTTLLKEWITDPEFRELILPSAPNQTGKANSEPGSIVVGIAVEPKTFEKIRAANGSPALSDVPPDQDAREFELHFEDRIDLDILTTREPGGPGAIAKFLAKFGEGIQQIEIYVRSVNRAVEILISRFGLKPIYPAPRAGAGGTRINFFLVSAPQGNKVLIELVESWSNNH
jgi:hypothetical protein